MRSLYIDLMKLRGIAFQAFLALPRWRFIKRYAISQRIVSLDLVLTLIEEYLPLMYGQQDSPSQKHWSN